MITKDGLTRIKWAGPNTVMIEIQRNDARLYITKKEALSLIEAVSVFKEAYPENFTPERIDMDDFNDYNWEWGSE